MRPLLVLVAGLLTANAAPAFAGTFFCKGVTSSTIVCSDVIAHAVTDEFTKKYPASQYSIYIASGSGFHANGSYSGTVAMWLGSARSHTPDAASYAAVHFVGQGSQREAVEHEKVVMQKVTQQLMRKLNVGVPQAPIQQAQAQQASARQCRTVQVTEQTLQSDYVCDYDNRGPTNCRTENKSVPRTVDKQVCTN